MRWWATYDLDYARMVYPFIRGAADFWQDYLIWDGNRYLSASDSIHEGSGEDLNPILSLGLIRCVLEIAIDMSDELGVDKEYDWRTEIESLIGGNEGLIVFVLDSKLDIKNTYITTWQILSHPDPQRDIIRSGNNIIINSTAKAHSSDNFPREWPNVVVSDNDTIKKVDALWDKLRV